MSYDLMVFEPMDIANTRNQFMEWYSKRTKWAEGHTYDDPAVATPSQRASLQTHRLDAALPL